MHTVRGTIMNTRSRFDKKLTGRACGVVVGAMMLVLLGVKRACYQIAGSRSK